MYNSFIPACVVVLFQGDSDPFIRQRLMAEVFLSCASEQYEGFVKAGIVYTDKKSQEAAKPLNAFNGFTQIKDCRLSGCFQEILLSDYSEKKLEAIDPKLIVLAPFTVPAKTNKTTLLAKGHEWQDEVRRIFGAEKRWEALNILGLFILNRFRKLSYEEVTAMRNFDLMDTVAGKQLYKIGLQKGELKGERKGQALRNTILKVLEARFELVPHPMVEQIRAINQLKELESLMIPASQCPDIDSFNYKRGTRARR